MYKKKIHALSYARLAAFIIGSMVLIFLTLSLASYYSHDSSWFYDSTAKQPIRNWCGWPGAQVSALLFFIFGLSAWLFIPLIMFCIVSIIRPISYFDEIDRIAAWPVLIGMSAGLCSSYTLRLYGDLFPGGYVGQAMHTCLSAWAGSFHANLFMAMMVLMSIIILSRGVVIVWALTGARAIWHSRILHACARICASAVSMLLQRLYRRSKLIVYRMYHGEAFPEPLSERDILDDIISQELGIEYAKDEAVIMSSMKHERADIQDVSTSQEPYIQEPVPQKHTPAVYRKPIAHALLNQGTVKQDSTNKGESDHLARVLEEKLKRFSIHGSVISITQGPVITLFEYEPHIDSKISKVMALEDDLTLALQALSIRIIAPIPGTSVIGFEVANKQRRTVLFAHSVQSPLFIQSAATLPIILGEDVTGKTCVADLAAMPHLLVAGSTGSGKSIGLNGMILSLLCKLSPQELRLIIIDPKRLDFAVYADIPHLLFPLITDIKLVAPALQWVIRTMEERYERMADASVKNILEYRLLSKNNAEYPDMPYIVIIIDELSDLMMTVGREIEDLIARIAQMARAAGIHMILATQRPSVDVVTGLIKVNFPSRIAFKVISKVDSRTILDAVGADKLLGKGDMLFLDSNGSVRRIHGAYVSTQEIEVIVNHCKLQQKPQYIDLMQEMAESGQHDPDDALYREVLSFLDSIDEVSISLLQRKFRIGYNRSARIIDELESRGVVMSSHGGKMRKVIKYKQ